MRRVRELGTTRATRDRESSQGFPHRHVFVAAEQAAFRCSSHADLWSKRSALVASRTTKGLHGASIRRTSERAARFVAEAARKDVLRTGWAEGEPNAAT